MIFRMLRDVDATAAVWYQGSKDEASDVIAVDGITMDGKEVKMLITISTRHLCQDSAS